MPWITVRIAREKKKFGGLPEKKVGKKKKRAASDRGDSEEEADVSEEAMGPEGCGNSKADRQKKVFCEEVRRGGGFRPG